MAISALQEESGLIFKARSVNTNFLPAVDCHLHTSWTDGQCSAEEMHVAAVKSEISVILFSEHSRKTSIDWFGDFVEDVRSLPRDTCKALVGTEVKIETRTGELDTTDKISDNCDFVMASVHRLIDDCGNTMQFAETDPLQAVEIEYDMTMAALENPKVNIIGHTFGMSFRRFKQNPPSKKIKDVIEKAANNNVVVELNSHYHEDFLEIFSWCKEYDAVISFGSNAHSVDKVGEMTRFLRRAMSHA